MPAQQAAQVAVTSVRYPGVPASVPVARHLLRAVLAGSPRLDDLELVVAELMTNAIRHTPSGGPGGSFTMTIRHTPRWARLEITDSGDGQWLVPPGDGTAEDGRGLVIVTMLADRFGRQADAGRSQVTWAEAAW
jgi:anti-sigma regulatory factor (Ser/Thr protein kinase)